MIQMKPDDRPTAEEILKHIFFINHGLKMTRSIEESENINDKTINNILQLQGILYINRYFHL